MTKKLESRRLPLWVIGQPKPEIPDQLLKEDSIAQKFPDAPQTLEKLLEWLKNANK
jgi:hypothetical protein